MNRKDRTTGILSCKVFDTAANIKKFNRFPILSSINNIGTTHISI